MRIQSFAIYGYQGDDDQEWGESFEDPVWSSVEAAIRRLDANTYAGVQFVLEGVYRDGGQQPFLDVAGGNG